MQITISPDQITMLRALIDPINEAHMIAECELPGFEIRISFVGPYGNFAVAHCSGQSIDLGEVAVDPDQHAWTVTSKESG